MTSQMGGEYEFGGISSLSECVIVIFCEEPTVSSSSKEVGTSACHCRESVTSTSLSSTFRLSRGPDPGREGVDFWVDLVPTLVRGGLGKMNRVRWSVVSGSGGTLTKRSSSPGLVRVVKGLVNCAGGGEESPEGVGEVNSLRLFASGGEDTVPEGSSF